MAAQTPSGASFAWLLAIVCFVLSVALFAAGQMGPAVIVFAVAVASGAAASRAKRG